MTKEEAIAAIRKAAGNALTDDDVKGLGDCTPDQLEYILTRWIHAGTVGDKDVWGDILDILKKVPDWLPVALKIAALVAKFL